ncbi:MAG: hypothetical protein Q4G30_02550 [Actinomycetaceae bacterium]|nr:hypothetical protein [Actinomycetaceae bacterium]
MSYIGEDLQWEPEDASYTRGRPDRYEGAVSLEPEWCQEVLHDLCLVAFEPDPKSRTGSSSFIGFSPSAGRVLVVIAFRDRDGDLHLINAWPASGSDKKFYEESD